MSAQRRMLGTFDLKASATDPRVRPDEIMINWTSLPEGSTAILYLPAVWADDILAAAAALHGYQPFARLDSHTVGCRAQGITYMPIPRAPGNLAGLLDVRLPVSVRMGARLTVAVHQLSSQSARIPGAGNTVDGSSVVYRPVAPAALINWRKVVGSFKLALEVRPTESALSIIERNLSLLLWMRESIPHDSRWYPIFVRYLAALDEIIIVLGGDPTKVYPSSTGIWQGASRSGTKPMPRGVVGKIEGLIFDHFGDFEGFILETEEDERIHFFSREDHVRQVAEGAWQTRLRVTVIPEENDDHRLRRIVLHRAPHPL